MGSHDESRPHPCRTEAEWKRIAFSIHELSKKSLGSQCCLAKGPRTRAGVDVTPRRIVGRDGGHDSSNSHKPLPLY